MSASTQRELNALADLLITGPVECPITPNLDEPSNGQRGGAFPLSSYRVELLMHGRVPGYPGEWLSQYASMRSRAGDSLLLVRAGEGNTQCEAYGSQEWGEERGLYGVLDEASREGMRIAFASPGAKPDELSRLASRIDRWTVLTGADEQSIVTCYQLLKMLVTRGDGVGPTGGVGLIFVGCDEAKSRGAARRIAEAAEQYLGLHVESAGLIQRIEPVSSKFSSVFPEPDPWAVIERACLGVEPVTEPKPAALPQPEKQMNAVSTPATTGLAQYVSGCVSLDARDPKRLDVELAVDADGRLHLFLPTAPAFTVEQSIIRLLATVRWARENLSLLAMTRRDRKFDTSAQPMGHLFTDNPSAALALKDSCFDESGPLRLHLLKPVALGAESRLVHERLI